MSEFSQSQDQDSPAKQAAIRKLLQTTSPKVLDAELNTIIGERHAQYAVDITERLKRPDLSDSERAMWEHSLEWQHQQESERAYMADPTLPRPEHLPPPMSDEQFAESLAKVNSVNLR